MSNTHRELQQAIGELPRDIQPERDLWQGIELGIERREDKAIEGMKKPNSTSWQYSMAASFFAVAIVGWMVVQQISTPTIEQSPSLSELANLLSEQHTEDKQQFLVSLQDQPALTANWEAQMSELDDAAGAIKAALAEDPTNSALLKMLQNVYQQQMNLIERVHSPKWREI